MTRAGLLLSIAGAASALAFTAGRQPLPQEDLFTDDASDVEVDYAFLTTPVDESAGEAFTDHRAWQHGIDLVSVGTRHLLVWSSWGNPPAPDPASQEHWHHKAYYSWVDPAHPQVNPQVLAEDGEAVEPASTAVNSKGRILMAAEDGDPDINEHAGLWDSAMSPIVAYPINVRTGGHSGHAAAMGDKFLTVYSEGWIDGGGVDNLGTGDDVWARIIDNDGSMSPEIPVSVDPSPDKRDWWPVVAASETEGIEVWQRYPSGTLQAAIIHADGARGPEIPLTDNIKYYYYNARWLPTLQRFAVFGSRTDGGFVALLDPDGHVVSLKTGLPATVRESKLVTRTARGSVIAVYPTDPTGATVLSITRSRIDLVRTIPKEFAWDYMGTDGTFVAPNRVLFVTLSKSGVQFVRVDL